MQSDLGSVCLSKHVLRYQWQLYTSAHRQLTGLCFTETQDVYSDGSSPHKSMVSDEPDEVFGDSIDEEGQVVRQPETTAAAAAPSTSGELQPHHRNPRP